MDWILFWEIGGEPGVKQFATFDPAQVNPRLELELSNLQVTHTEDSDLLTTVVVSVGPTVSIGQSVYVEAVCYGKPAADGTSSARFRVGLWNLTNDPTVNDAGAGDCYTFDPDTGNVIVDEAVVATFAAALPGDVIGLELDRTTLPSTLRIYVNGALIGAYELDFDVEPAEWAFHASVAGLDAFTNRVFMNFGQRAFEYPVPAGAREGLYTQSVAPPVFRIATETFVTSIDDTPANTTYDGRLPESFDVTTKRSVRQWTWGRSGGESKPADIEILNGDGRYDGILSDGYRDQPVVGRILERGHPLASAITIATAVVDQVIADGENLIRVRQRDKLSKLDVPLQRRLFLPSVTDNAANQPVPITLGTARNVDPVLYDDEELAYALSDQEVAAIVVVRDKGDPLDPDETPPDWVYNELQTGFILESEAVGKLTADVSSTGGSGLDPTPDELVGAADPFTWSAGAVVGFDDVSYSEIDGSSGQHTVTDPGAGVGITLARDNAGDPSIAAWCGKTSFLTPGETYRYRVEIVDWINPSGNSAVALNVNTGKTALGRVGGPMRGIGIFTGTFVAAAHGDAFLTLSFDTLDKSVTVQTFTIESTNAVNFDDFDDAIAGITLPDFAEEVLQNRAHLGADEWSRVSAELVDVAGYDCGIYAKNQITCRAALDMIIDSYAGWYFQDREGVIRFGQLFDPANESISVAAFFDIADVLGDVQVEFDRAPGLSTTIACRRNWAPYSDADFVDDFVDVPSNLRARFRREFQFVRASAANLAETYQHARQASPIETLIDDPNDAQAEIDRVCELYTVQRQFVRFTVGVIDGSEFSLEPGDVISLSMPRFGLDNGRRILLLDVIPTALRGQVELYGWF